LKKEVTMADTHRVNLRKIVRILIIKVKVIRVRK